MSLWYIGDPCYAINNDKWGEFCDILSKHKNDALEGHGIEFDWNWIQHQRIHHETYFEELEVEQTSRVYVYNSGLGGDGQVNVHGYKLGVDAGLLSVLPLEVCHRLTDAEKTEGQHGSSHAIVEARFRPVFDIDTNNFPNITLDINGSIQHDTTGMSECDECGEWCYDNNMMTTTDGDYKGDCCYEEDEEGEDL